MLQILAADIITYGIRYSKGLLLSKRPYHTSKSGGLGTETTKNHINVALAWGFKHKGSHPLKISYKCYFYLLMCTKLIIHNSSVST